MLIRAIKIISKVAGFSLIIVTIFVLVSVLVGGDNETGGGVIAFFISPPFLGLGLLLVKLGSSKKIDSAQRELAPKSSSVRLGRVIFVIGVVIFSFLIFWFAAVLLGVFIFKVTQ